MPMYHIMITKHRPLREYPDIVFSGFVSSDKKTVEEVEKELLDYHKKKGVSYKVRVMNASSLEEKEG